MRALHSAASDAAEQLKRLCVRKCINRFFSNISSRERERGINSNHCAARGDEFYSFCTAPHEEMEVDETPRDERVSGKSFRAQTRRKNHDDEDLLDEGMCGISNTVPNSSISTFCHLRVES
jgi:hypothetical protein